MLADLAGPLLFLFILHVSLVRKANRSFNFTNLFFFPKDTGYTADRQRPISVSNTDNRLVASAVRRCITPAIADLLEKSQTAFVPGASIEDNITFFNDRFYSRLQDGGEYHLLLHDFRAAYDSVSRRFLASVLQKIGMPEWVISVIDLLFEHIVAFPILHGTHKVKIKMGNGLKQGCPLSPILFNLVLDPLMTFLERLREKVDKRAYADDLGLGAEALALLAAPLPLINQYNAASGGESSTTKTVRQLSPTSGTSSNLYWLLNGQGGHCQ